MSRRLSRYLLASALLLVVALLVRRTLGLRDEERRLVPSVDRWPPIREGEAEAVAAAVVEAAPAAAVVQAGPATAAVVEAAVVETPVVETPLPEAALPEAAPVVQAALPEAAPVVQAALPEAAPVVQAAPPEAAPVVQAAPPEAAPVVEATPAAPVGTAPHDATAAWAPPQADGCPDGYPIKAKVASGIYHLPGMVNYTRTRPDRCYASEEAAVEDGFVKAKR